MLDLILAVLHHILVFGLVAMIMAERVLLRALPIDVNRLARLDAGVGGAAVMVLIVGVCRAIWGGKGWMFYEANPFFWAKVITFGLIAAASIPPAGPQTPAPRESAAAPRAASTPPSRAHDALRGRRIEPPAIDEAPTEAAPVAEVEAAGPDPAYALALRRRGQRALLEGRVHEAATQLLEATRSAPTDAVAWRALGLAYEQLGRPDEARRAYGRVLHLLPGDAATRTRLERL